MACGSEAIPESCRLDAMPSTRMSEVHQGSFDPVYVANSIDLMVEFRGGSSTRVLRPADLHAALERDARSLDDLSENPDRGLAGKAVAVCPISTGGPR